VIFRLRKVAAQKVVPASVIRAPTSAELIAPPVQMLDPFGYLADAELNDARMAKKRRKSRQAFDRFQIQRQRIIDLPLDSRSRPENKECRVGSAQSLPVCCKLFCLRNIAVQQ